MSFNLIIKNDNKFRAFFIAIVLAFQKNDISLQHEISNKVHMDG